MAPTGQSDLAGIGGTREDRRAPATGAQAPVPAQSRRGALDRKPHLVHPQDMQIAVRLGGMDLVLHDEPARHGTLVPFSPRTSHEAMGFLKSLAVQRSTMVA